MRSMLAAAGAALLLLVRAAPALACQPACSGYHLSFTSPVGAGVTADQSLTVIWVDAVDGPGATFDLMVSSAPVPVYPMHSFPAQLPGEILAFGLSATAASSYRWDTSARAPGAYYLYAVFHNPPFNTLVLPFAAVAVSHGQALAALALITSPRGLNVATDVLTLGFDASAPNATALVDVYVGSPPDAADGTLIATGLPARAGQTLQWDPIGRAPGSYVFKAVVRDEGGALATAFSPGIVQVGGDASPGSGGCAVGDGAAAWLAVGAIWAALRRRPRSAIRLPAAPDAHIACGRSRD